MSLVPDYSKTQDSRSHWQKFNRRELYAIANLENIEFTHGAPAYDIINALNMRAVDPNKYRPQRLGPLYGDSGKQEYRVRKELLRPKNQKIPEPTLTDQEIKVEIENVDPSTLRFNEKKKFCRQHGIAFDRHDTNFTLQNKITVYMSGKNVT